MDSSSTTHTSQRDILVKSVRTIEGAWIVYRNQRIFRLLKHAIRAAEEVMPSEILRRICPREAHLFNDPCTQIKVRLRFGGSSFPPLIFFKIFLCNANGRGVTYFTGKRMIRPYSNAARSACQLMGTRVFYNQLVTDTILHQVHGVTDEMDVSTLKDYMKYSSVLDETPASLGGRENLWRQLTLEALPRHVMFYDVIDYAYNRRITPSLSEELPTLLLPPLNPDVQLQHIDILTRTRAPPMTPATRPTRLMTSPDGATGATSRRSTKARQRVAKLRAAYRHGDAQSDGSVTYGTEATVSARSVDAEQNVDDEEAFRLYEWTQTLSVDESMTTPRVWSI